VTGSKSPLETGRSLATGCRPDEIAAAIADLIEQPDPPAIAAVG
jgi:hypothetical protein